LSVISYNVIVALNLKKVNGLVEIDA
jgi:hypothetical protein